MKTQPTKHAQTANQKPPEIEPNDDEQIVVTIYIHAEFNREFRNHVQQSREQMNNPNNPNTIRDLAAMISTATYAATIARRITVHLEPKPNHDNHYDSGPLQ